MFFLKMRTIGTQHFEPVKYSSSNAITHLIFNKHVMYTIKVIKSPKTNKTLAYLCVITHFALAAMCIQSVLLPSNTDDRV